jgi:hypothetical protein
MFHSNSLISASLSVALAAGAAGVFTIATGTSANDQAQVQTAKSNSLSRPELRSIFFDAKPIAGSRRMTKENEIVPSSAKRGITGDQIAPEQRTNDSQQKRPMTNGCESGLSPDLSPTVPIPASRCLT